MEQRSSTSQRTEEIHVELERLLLRLRSELVELFQAECNFRVTINGSAGRTGKIEVTKFVSF